MLSTIKIFYKENRIWMYLLKYITISIIIAIMAILIDTKFFEVLNILPDILLTSVDLAKLILSTLAGSLLTITTFTFSTIMVVLTMYSSNFSPRVVNNFLTDKITMKVLGVFIGGFFYCILTLFFMRNIYSEYLVVSATIAVIYSAFCIVYFVMFVFRVSSSIQATKLIGRLYEESLEIVENTLKERKTKENITYSEMTKFSNKLEIPSNQNGYLELISFTDILFNLKNLESSLIVNFNIGDFISENEIIATLYYSGDIKKDALKANLEKNFSIEGERIEYNDYRYSIQKIVDITLRAISPGINDPNTAIHCINILGVLLSKLGKIEGSYNIIKEDSSKTRIIYEDFDFKEDLYFTFYQIAHYGKK
ncbi:MAG: DUF2254 domain-containing protein, partial [Clostridium sp.]|nr:DUF2254 domain-containing protein [Clostridium sp.]